MHATPLTNPPSDTRKSISEPWSSRNPSTADPPVAPLPRRPCRRRGDIYDISWVARAQPGRAAEAVEPRLPRVLQNMTGWFRARPYATTPRRPEPPQQPEPASSIARTRALWRYPDRQAGRKRFLSRSVGCLGATCAPQQPDRWRQASRRTSIPAASALRHKRDAQTVSPLANAGSDHDGTAPVQGVSQGPAGLTQRGPTRGREGAHGILRVRAGVMQEIELCRTVSGAAFHPFSQRFCCRLRRTGTCQDIQSGV